MMEIMQLLLGMALLVGGAELLVRGASRLAYLVGISPLVVGLTVVAYGTSAPELMVSVRAALQGESAVSVGNVVGSNIFNVLFILGASALIRPLVVAQQLVSWDVPIMIAVSCLAFLFAGDGEIERGEGALLLLGAAAYTVLAIRQSRRESRAVKSEYDRELGAPAPSSLSGILVQLSLLAAGLGLLMLGARQVVDAAVQLARNVGVSELLISLTIVAAGTSLPEVATSILATIRGERDIAVGNVVGSNIFNVLCVLGASGLVASQGLPVPEAAVRFDIPVMIAVAAACLPVFFTGHLIARWEGSLFLAYYVVYTVYLILSATGHARLSSFSTLMLGFVIPLTAVTLLVVTVRQLRARQARRVDKTPCGRS
jgi:cation:H+ antiporter